MTFSYYRPQKAMYARTNGMSTVKWSSVRSRDRKVKVQYTLDQIDRCQSTTLSVFICLCSCLFPCFCFCMFLSASLCVYVCSCMFLYVCVPVWCTCVSHAHTDIHPRIDTQTILFLFLFCDISPKTVNQNCHSLSKAEAGESTPLSQ